MKPEDFKPPHPKGERRIFIYDSVWFIPNARLPASNTFLFPGWDHQDLFGNANPVCVEYCSGNGAWIASKAQENPGINWVAVEMKFERVRKIWSKIKNLGLKNLIVICGEALNATKTYIQDSSIQDVYINFPDPWPKKRHFKNRLIQDEFVSEVLRILKPCSLFTFVTDDAPYSEWFIETIGRNLSFQSIYPSPCYVTESPGYGSSYFEELWRLKGKTIRYHRYKKVN